MKRTKLKLLMVFLMLILIFGTIFTYLNINMTSEYPINKVCKEIRDFNIQHERFPTVDEFNSLNVPEVGLFSTIEYRKIDNDFVFYFCPTYLGPCEVCTLEDGPYFDEI